jgi:hypothetical protein
MNGVEGEAAFLKVLGDTRIPIFNSNSLAMR